MNSIKKNNRNLVNKHAFYETTIGAKWNVCVEWEDNYWNSIKSSSKSLIAIAPTDTLNISEIVGIGLSK